MDEAKAIDLPHSTSPKSHHCHRYRLQRCHVQEDHETALRSSIGMDSLLQEASQEG